MCNTCTFPNLITKVLEPDDGNKSGMVRQTKNLKPETKNKTPNISNYHMYDTIHTYIVDTTDAEMMMIHFCRQQKTPGIPVEKEGPQRESSQS